MIFNRYIITLIIFISFIGTTFGQAGRTNSSNYPRSGERYITDEDGIIKMWVNVWGQVTRPGSYLVYDGIDLASLISTSGGPKPGADLKSIRLYREIPDAKGQLSISIDLENFLNSGDRGDFTHVLPNDTYVIPQSFSSYILFVNPCLNNHNGS